jgi:peptide deformylase
MRDSNTTTSTRAGAAQAAGRFIPPATGRWPVRWRVPTAVDLEAIEAGYRRGLIPAHLPVLHEPAPPLKPGSADATEVAERLYKAARREADAAQGHAMVGLAAPQVGIPARAFLFDPREDSATDKPPVDQLRCVINPTVDAVTDKLIREVEGCLSIPPIKGWVQRTARVRLRGYTPDGELIDEDHAGLAARVVQHEADHLDGIEFPQRIADDYDLLWASVEQVEAFTAYARAHRRGEKPPWNIRTPRDQWDAIRAGLAVFGSLADSPDGLE